MKLGSVVSLRRYPIKSMLGEELSVAHLTQKGLLGDRTYALVDAATGKVVSAKHPAKWGKVFGLGAAYAEPPRAGAQIPPVRITFPDGTTVTSEQSDVNDRVSKAVGRQVALDTKAPRAASLEEYWPDMDGLVHRETVTDEVVMPDAFFDFGSVSVLTTATLARLGELYPQGRFEPQRFRPNIVVEVDSGEKSFIEHSWVDHTLTIGDDVRLAINYPTPRCVMTTLAQGDLPEDPGILRTAAQHNQSFVGVYAAVLREGTIRCGDPVTLE